MKLLPVKDNTTYEKERFSDIGDLMARIAGKTLKELEQEGVFVLPKRLEDSEDLEKDQMILRRDGDGCRTGNVMGFLGCGGERLIIESRFSGPGEDYFAPYLLARVLKTPNIVALDTGAGLDNRLFDLLLLAFPYYLKTAMRKGLFKTYIRRRYNDSNVKGTIDIARHIQKNTPFLGNVAYNTRELSYDNDLTELVRHTIEFIRGKPYGNRLLDNVRDEVKAVTSATPGYRSCDRQKVISGNKASPVRHAYFREYMDSLIGGRFHHPKNKRREGKQLLFSGDKGENEGEIYPDFIGRDPKRRLIADAKYKPAGNIGNKDYKQMLLYMFRFDARTSYLLYPETTGPCDTTLRLNRGTTYEGNTEPREDVCVIKHGLRIPQDADSYDDFAEKMKAAEREFLKPFDGR